MRAAASERCGSKRRAAWNSWCAYAMERHALARAAASFISPDLRKAMSAWYEMVEEEYARAEKMHAAVKALTSSGLRLGFNSWLSYANEAMEAYQVMRRAASAFSPRLQSMLKALNTWAERSEEMRRLAQAAGCFKSPALRAAYNQWAHEAFEAIQRER